MPYAHVDDLQMYYEALGPPEGVPVVLLHGAGGDSDWASMPVTRGINWN